MIRRLALWGFGLWLVGFLAALGAQTLWAPGQPDTADVILCLGADMRNETDPDPGPGSIRRAQTCAALYAAGVAPVVIFAGGGNDFASAAEGMAVVAMDAGMPPEALRVEPLSQSTIQNAAFSRPLLPDGAQDVLLVSDGFHLPRSWIIFRALSYEHLSLHPTQNPGGPSIIRWCLRESVAIWFNLWRAGLYAAGGVFGIDANTRIAWFN